MPNNILVTGASSPIGAYFCGRLAKENPDRAIIGTYGKNMPDVQAKNLSYVRTDFLGDATENISATMASGIGAVIHLASVTPGNNTDSDIQHYYNGNVHGVMALIKHIGAPQLFYLSSSAVYNRSKGTLLDETSEKTHLDHYGLSKLMFEGEIATLAAHRPLQALGLRVPVLLTEGVKYNFMSKWKQAIREGQRLKIGNPDAPFNAVCPGWALYDACKAHMDRAEEGARVSNVFASEPTSLRKILDAVDYRLWDEVPAAAPAQLIQTLHAQKLFPAYSALDEVRSFLL